MLLTETQQQLLVALRDALLAAMNKGVLDVLQPECDSPDSINDVCDAVDQLILDECA